MLTVEFGADEPVLNPEAARALLALLIAGREICPLVEATHVGRTVAADLGSPAAERTF